MKHILYHEKDYILVNDIGAELTNYHNKQEYLWHGDPMYWSGRSPHLFPNPGTLLDDKIKIYGKEYKIPKHGLLIGKQFVVEDKTENSILLSYTYNDETLSMYPFKFKFFVRHTINKNGFSTEYIVENKDDKTMIFCIGAHPSFQCPMYLCEEFEDCDIVFQKPEQSMAYYTNKGKYMDRSLFHDRLNGTNTWQLKYEDFDEDSSIFENVESKYVSLLHRESKDGIRINIEQFPNVVVWTPEGKKAPFICIEPWHGLPATLEESGNFEDKPYAISLDSGKTYEIGYSVEIIK